MDFENIDRIEKELESEGLDFFTEMTEKSIIISFLFEDGLKLSNFYKFILTIQKLTTKYFPASDWRSKINTSLTKNLENILEIEYVKWDYPTYKNTGGSYGHTNTGNFSALGGSLDTNLSNVFKKGPLNVSFQAMNKILKEENYKRVNILYLEASLISGIINKNSDKKYNPIPLKEEPSGITSYYFEIGDSSSIYIDKFNNSKKESLFVVLVSNQLGPNDSTYDHYILYDLTEMAKVVLKIPDLNKKSFQTNSKKEWFEITKNERDNITKRWEYIRINEKELENWNDEIQIAILSVDEDAYVKGPRVLAINTKIYYLWAIYKDEEYVASIELKKFKNNDSIDKEEKFIVEVVNRLGDEQRYFLSIDHTQLKKIITDFV